MNAQKMLMTTFGAITLLLSACSALATPQPTPTLVPTPTPTTARFEGTIYFLDEPFVGAMVDINDPSKDAKDPNYKIAEVTTDVQGSYSFVVDPGQYILGVTLAFSESDYPCPASQSFGIPATWIPSESTSETDATKLTNPWFGVWGTQSDQSGAPLRRLLIASSDSITVAAGDVVQRDMFAICYS
jgi:hypothetical protein